MLIGTLVKKELRLLARDPRVVILLLAMPLVLILTVGLLVGDTFGLKSDNLRRFYVVDLDQGSGLNPGEPWSRVVIRDLADTAGIKVEVIDGRDQAVELIRNHKIPAVLIFEPTFTDKLNRCSFLSDGINPFHRDGVYLDKIDATFLKDAKQPISGPINEQVAQMALIRVILPWMIGRAFERLGDAAFIELLGNQVQLPVPAAWQLLIGKQRLSLNEMLALAAGKDKKVETDFRKKVGEGVQKSLQEQFKNYELTGKTWAKLTKSKVEMHRQQAEPERFVDRGGAGVARRGAYRWNIIVPSFTVMFSFFIVLIMGWLFVGERRQGTLRRLRAAPTTRVQVLMGKLLPCLFVSVTQGILLLLFGKVVVDMRWGPPEWSLGQQVLWLLPVLITTSAAAVGLAMLIGAVAQTEMQVAIYGVLTVLVLAVIGGCIIPREMMPEETQPYTLLSPLGWAVDAYRELLTPDSSFGPNLNLVAQSCLVLGVIGAAFAALAAWLLRLE